VKHHWGKGNQFYINEGAGPPGPEGWGPIGEIRVYLRLLHNNGSTKCN